MTKETMKDAFVEFIMKLPHINYYRSLGDYVYPSSYTIPPLLQMFMESNGIGLDFSGNTERPVWDGVSLAVIKIKDIGSLVHELCHFMISPPHRRFLNNFGLGSNSEEGMAESVVNLTESYIEEQYAAVLGLMIELYLGLQPINTVLDICKNTIGEDVDLSSFVNRVVKKLQKYGFIGLDFVPTWRLSDEYLVFNENIIYLYE